MTSKPRVAFFDFTGCEGDQLQVVNLEERLLELVEVVDVVSFREAMSEHAEDYDVAFVEGSITTPHDAERLREVRENADTVIAIGSCAAFGGINALRNHQDLETAQERVYGVDATLFEDQEADLFDSFEAAQPASAFVDVEYEIPGCPIDGEEFIQTVTALLNGAEPTLPNHPVCVECKFEENACAFDRGEICLGPITRGGCGATCVSQGTRCWGCRGMVEDPSQDAYTDVLEGHGLTVEAVLEEYQLYWGWQREHAAGPATEEVEQ
jgi:coenzyme F420-reducing hydrogenase gamma subunit